MALSANGLVRSPDANAELPEPLRRSHEWIEGIHQLLDRAKEATEPDRILRQAQRTLRSGESFAKPVVARAPIGLDLRAPPRRHQLPSAGEALVVFRHGVT